MTTPCELHPSATLPRPCPPSPGVLPPSNGEALVHGQPITSSGGMDQIRSMMGVCPQFDVLWGELTGAEHLNIYGHVKGVYWRHVNSQCEELLDRVRVGKCGRCGEVWDSWRRHQGHSCIIHDMVYVTMRCGPVCFALPTSPQMVFKIAALCPGCHVPLCGQPCCPVPLLLCGR